MELLEEIVWAVGEREHRIELLVGDLSQIPDEYAVDALVVSAFPDSYAPTPGTLIAALTDRGLGVGDLAADKDQDLRETSSCWLSKPISADLGFRRVICFEPPWGVAAPEVVGDLFRGLVPLSSGEPWIRTVATSLLASGQQGESHEAMLRSIVEAAHRWISTGADIDALRVVLFYGMPQEEQNELRAVFTDAADKVVGAAVNAAQEQARFADGRDRRYDLFVSYSRSDKPAADRLINELEERHPEIRIYRDLEKLDTGSAWQRELYEAIDDSRYVVCLYSPGYLASKVCIEELHIGMFRHRVEGGVLIPAYLRSAQLPSYLQVLQYSDIRESDDRLLADFAESVVRKVRNQKPGERRSATRAEPESKSVAVQGESGTTISVGDLQEVLSQLASDGEVRLDVRIRVVRD